MIIRKKAAVNKTFIIYNIYYIEIYLLYLLNYKI